MDHLLQCKIRINREDYNYVLKTTKLRKFAVGFLVASMTICFTGLGHSAFAASKTSSKTFRKVRRLQCSAGKESTENKNVKLVDTAAHAVKKSGTTGGASVMTWQQISNTPATGGVNPGDAGFARSFRQRA